MACLSSDGRLLVFGMDEMKSLTGGGRGVTLIGLDDKQTLVSVVPIGEAGVTVYGEVRGGKLQAETLSGPSLAPNIGKRARKGRAPAVKFATFKPRSLEPVLPAALRHPDGSHA